MVYIESRNTGPREGPALTISLPLRRVFVCCSGRVGCWDGLGPRWQGTEMLLVRTCGRRRRPGIVVGGCSYLCVGGVGHDETGSVEVGVVRMTVLIDLICIVAVRCSFHFVVFSHVLCSCVECLEAEVCRKMGGTLKTPKPKRDVAEYLFYPKTPPPASWPILPQTRAIWLITLEQRIIRPSFHFSLARKHHIAPTMAWCK